MQLTLADRRVGDATVLTCRGRLIAGKEVAALQHALDTLSSRTRHIVLDLSQVDFIDSSALGLLVRYFVRAKRSSSTLTVCAVSSKIDEVLRVTKLRTIFPPYETEAEAIADAHRTEAGAEAGAGPPTLLCVDASPDVSTYLRELLKAAGYRVLSAQSARRPHFARRLEACGRCSQRRTARGPGDANGGRISSSGGHSWRCHATGGLFGL